MAICFPYPYTNHIRYYFHYWFMVKRGVSEWIHRRKNYDILISFSTPKTPRQAERDAGIKKIKLKPFLERELIDPLNPKSRKGRLYLLTKKGRKHLKLPNFNKEIDQETWDLIGSIIASPKQKFVTLKTITLDRMKRTSEDIRKRASTLNPHLSRISTKQILKELISVGLIESELNERKRYYCISDKGKSLIDDIQHILLVSNYEIFNSI